MPTRSATRRIESASAPSASSSARAASTISRARGASASGTLEALARAQAVADGAIQGDMAAPGQRTDQEAGADQAEQRRSGEQGGAGQPVQGVVQRHGARVELAALEAPAGAGEQRDVGCDGEH